MDYRAFEQRLLDTIFTTDVQLTPATIAFLYKIQVQEAADLLQQAAVAGLLNIESDDEGNILYTYPNRIKLPPRGGASSQANGPAISSGGSPPGALVRVETGAVMMQKAAARDGLTTPTALRDPEPRGLALRDLSREADFDRLPSLAMDSLPAELMGANGHPGHHGPYGQQHGQHGANGYHGHSGHQSEGVSAPGHTRCPFCNEQIVIGAKKCKHCHEYLDYALRDIHARQGISQVSVALQPVSTQQTAITQWTGTQAALLSLFMPGLGQMCSGRVPAGLLWMMFTIMGYLCLIVPGFILHVLCVINASRIPRQAS